MTLNFDGVPLDGASRRRDPATVDAEYHDLQRQFSDHLLACGTCPSLETIYEFAGIMVDSGNGHADVMDVMGNRFCETGKEFVGRIGKLAWERGDSWRASSGVIDGITGGYIKPR